MNCRQTPRFLGCLFALLLFSSSVLSQPLANDEQLQNDSNFLRTTWLTRARIAHDVNLLRSYFSATEFTNQNVIDYNNPLTDVEVKFYGRLLSGMVLIGYHYDRTSVSSSAYFNPAYDVLMFAEWGQIDNRTALLKKLFLVPGELLRNEPVTVSTPGWTKEGSVDALVNAFRIVFKNCRNSKCSRNFSDIVKTHQWTLQDGQKMDDRAVVHQRVMTLGSYVLSHTKSLRLDSMPAQEAATFQAARPAVLAADHLQECLKAGTVIKEVLRCELQKDQFETISIPEKVLDERALGIFLAYTYNEGAIGIGDIGIAFVGSPVQANHFLFILTTVKGKPLGLSLVDLFSQTNE